MKKIILTLGLICSTSVMAGTDVKKMNGDQLFNVISICNERNSEVNGLVLAETNHVVQCKDGSVFTFKLNDEYTQNYESVKQVKVK